MSCRTENADNLKARMMTAFSNSNESIIRKMIVLLKMAFEKTTLLLKGRMMIPK